MWYIVQVGMAGLSVDRSQCCQEPPGCTKSLNSMLIHSDGFGREEVRRDSCRRRYSWSQRCREPPRNIRRKGWETSCAWGWPEVSFDLIQLASSASPLTTRKQTLGCENQMKIGFCSDGEGEPTPWRWRVARWKWGQTGSTEAGCWLSVDNIVQFVYFLSFFSGLLQLPCPLLILFDFSLSATPTASSTWPTRTTTWQGCDNQMAPSWGLLVHQMFR